MEGLTHADPAERALLSGLAEHAAAARASAKASEALGHELWSELELARRAARGVLGAPARPRTKTSRPEGGSYEETGGDLLSQALASQVPSALWGLTALFGMGRGVSPTQ